MTLPKNYIIINPHCHQGRGWKRWQAIRNEVLKQIPGSTEIVTENTDDLGWQLSHIFNSNEESHIISAGGDGSLHQLCNELLRNGRQDKHIIGAIGIGSSNDFLKPFQSFVNNIPVRTNINKPCIAQDVGKVKFIDENNLKKEKFFIINASFGATAEGNWNFNNPSSILKWLKKTDTGMAITYTAITTILAYKNKKVIFRFNSEERDAAITNINILKIPFVSGSLYYKQNIFPDDGRLGLNVCMNMKKAQLFQTLLQLEKGIFTPSEKKLSAFTNNFQLSSNYPIIFECDGETEKITNVEISVLPKAINFISP